MNPNQKCTPGEIVNVWWTWRTDAAGMLTDLSIQTAALVDLARTMRRIETQIQTLGNDGIHQLIREELKELRRKTRARKTRGKKR
jgi:hypothetical protein